MKNTMLLAFIVFTFSCCKTSKINNPQFIDSKQHFTVINASYLSLVDNTSKEKSISVTIDIDNSKIKLDSLYFKNTGIKLEQDLYSKANSFKGNFIISKKQDYILDGDSKKEFGNTAPDISLKIPYNLQKDEAVITYFFNGNAFYKRIILLEK